MRINIRNDVYDSLSIGNVIMALIRGEKCVRRSPERSHDAIRKRFVIGSRLPGAIVAQNDRIEIPSKLSQSHSLNK